MLIQLISFSTPKLLGKATLEDLADEGSCKQIMSHPYMQQHLNEVHFLASKFFKTQHLT